MYAADPDDLRGWPGGSATGSFAIRFQQAPGSRAGAAVHRPGRTTGRMKSTGHRVLIWQGRAGAYRVERIEHRRAVELRRPEHGRRPVRDAPRDGAARRACARPKTHSTRSCSPRRSSASSGTSCALPAFQLTKVGISGPFPFLIAIGFCGARLPPGRRRPLRPPRRAPRRARIDEALHRGGSLRRVARPQQSSSSCRRGAAFPCPSRPPCGSSPIPSSRSSCRSPSVTRRQPGARRALWVAALAIFAVSALHLSHFRHGYSASWPSSSPATTPRFRSPSRSSTRITRSRSPISSSNGPSRCSPSWPSPSSPIVVFGSESIGPSPRSCRPVPRQVGVLVALFVATALLYPLLRRGTAWFVDPIVLHRADYPSLRRIAGAARPDPRRDRGAPHRCGRAPRPAARRPRSGMAGMAGVPTRRGPRVAGPARSRRGRPPRVRRPGRRGVAGRRGCGRWRRWSCCPPPIRPAMPSSSPNSPAAAVSSRTISRRSSPSPFSSRGESTRSASRVSATSASSAIRRSAASSPRPSSAPSARRSSRTSCSTR